MAYLSTDQLAELLERFLVEMRAEPGATGRPDELIAHLGFESAPRRIVRKQLIFTTSYLFLLLLPPKPNELFTGCFCPILGEFLFCILLLSLFRRAVILGDRLLDLTSWSPFSSWLLLLLFPAST
jgi:hypothetical protein